MEQTEQTWEKQVRAKVSCPGCNGAGSYQMLERPEPGFGRTCGRCGGTGSVLLLPGLSEECPGMWVVVEDKRPAVNFFGVKILHLSLDTVLGESMDSIPHGVEAMQKHLPEGCRCHGTGRAAKPIDMALLLDEMRKAGFEWSGTETSWFFFWAGENRDRGFVKVDVEDSNDRAACVEAARKAVEARYPQKEKA